MQEEAARSDAAAAAARPPLLVDVRSAAERRVSVIAGSVSQAEFEAADPGLLEGRIIVPYWSVLQLALPLYGPELGQEEEWELGVWQWLLEVAPLSGGVDAAAALLEPGQVFTLDGLAAALSAPTMHDTNMVAMSTKWFSQIQWGRLNPPPTKINVGG